MIPIVKILKVGKVDYLSGLKLQKRLTDLHFETSNVANTLLFLEHPPVFTTGIRTKEYTEDDEKRLKETAGPRYMQVKYHDAMAIVAILGKPNYLLSVTCNPHWLEIQKSLKPGESYFNRLYACARVFHLKLKKLTRLMMSGKLFRAEFYRTNRGGLITFHGPGQLVVYPILNLKHFKASIRWYVCHIEKTVIKLCQSLGLNAETSPQTGVWIGNKKICAVGVHGSRFITSHGLALNCCTDLKWYKHIDPCGIKDKGVTSLSVELNRHVSISDTIPLFLESFKEVFNCSYVDYDRIELDALPLSVR